MTAMICVVALAFAACSAPPARPADGNDPSPLVWRLDAPGSVPAGGPAPIRFTLENRGDRPLWVLTWYTPLEGLLGDIMEVTLEGERIPYGGPMVKRAAPTAEDYVRIDPGQAVSNEFDLAAGYDMSGVGRYRVDFGGRLHDVATRGEALEQRANQPEPRQVPGDGLSLLVSR